MYDHYKLSCGQSSSPANTVFIRDVAKHMKQIYLILFFIPTIGFSQMRERLNSTDIERYGFKGSVLEIIHKEYEPRYSNDSTYTLELYDFLAPHNYKLEFNQNGNLSTRTELRKENDSLIAGAIWNYKYDRNNRIQQEKRISYQYSKDTTIWNYEYKGDSIINVQQLDETYKILYFTYRQEGNFEYLNQANSDSSYITKKRFVYDEQNRLTRSEDYRDRDYIQDLRLISYVDSISKNIYKSISVDAKYNNNWYTEYSYNTKGDVTAMSIGNFSNDRKPVNKYEYIYDKNGNWVEKRHYGARGKLSTVFKREIRYFE